MKHPFLGHFAAIQSLIQALGGFMYAINRTSPRFNLEIPIRIRRLDETGSAEFTVLSSNLSAGGLHFFSDVEFERGALVRAYFRIPEYNAGKSVPRWCCEGRVVHVHPSDRKGKERGAGISFQLYGLVTPELLEATGEQLPLRSLSPRMI